MTYSTDPNSIAESHAIAIAIAINPCHCQSTTFVLNILMQ